MNHVSLLPQEIYLLETIDKRVCRQHYKAVCFAGQLQTPDLASDLFYLGSGEEKERKKEKNNRGVVAKIWWLCE
jgi:hypothetical protein